MKHTDTGGREGHSDNLPKFLVGCHSDLLSTLCLLIGFPVRRLQSSKGPLTGRDDSVVLFVAIEYFWVLLDLFLNPLDLDPRFWLVELDFEGVIGVRRRRVDPLALATTDGRRNLSSASPFHVPLQPTSSMNALTSCTDGSSREGVGLLPHSPESLEHDRWLRAEVPREVVDAVQVQAGLVSRVLEYELLEIVDADCGRVDEVKRCGFKWNDAPQLRRSISSPIEPPRAAPLSSLLALDDGVASACGLRVVFGPPLHGLQWVFRRDQDLGR